MMTPRLKDLQPPRPPKMSATQLEIYIREQLNEALVRIAELEAALAHALKSGTDDRRKD
jgi:hypothetical protein